MARGKKRKAVTNTETAAKRAKGETDLNGDLKWSYEGEVGNHAPYIQPLLKLTSDTVTNTEKAIGFDIDFTIITTKSGRKFPTGKLTYDCLTKYGYLFHFYMTNRCVNHSPFRVMGHL